MYSLESTASTFSDYTNDANMVVAVWKKCWKYKKTLSGSLTVEPGNAISDPFH